MQTINGEHRSSQMSTTPTRQQQEQAANSLIYKLSFELARSSWLENLQNIARYRTKSLALMLISLASIAVAFIPLAHVGDTALTAVFTPLLALGLILVAAPVLLIQIGFTATVSTNPHKLQTWVDQTPETQSDPTDWVYKHLAKYDWESVHEPISGELSKRSRLYKFALIAAGFVFVTTAATFIASSLATLLW